MAAASLCAARPVCAAGADGGDAQRLVTILDYISTDYAGAVAHGAVTSALEYDEQKGFIADRHAARQGRQRRRRRSPERAGHGDRRTHRRSGGSRRGRTSLPRGARRSGGALRPRHRAGRAPLAAGGEHAVRRGLRRLPRQDRRRQHGACGHPRPAARQLPRPRAPRGALALPRLQYADLRRARHRHGVLRRADRRPSAGASPSTSSASAHAGERAQGAAGVRLSDLARATDADLQQRLAAELPGAEVAPAVAFLRSEAPFIEPPAAAGIAMARKHLGLAATAYAAGRKGDAERALVGRLPAGVRAARAEADGERPAHRAAHRDGIRRPAPRARRFGLARQLRAPGGVARRAARSGRLWPRPRDGAVPVGVPHRIPRRHRSRAAGGGAARRRQAPRPRRRRAHDPRRLASRAAGGCRHLVGVREAAAPRRRAARADGGARRPRRRRRALLGELLDDLEGRVAPLARVPAPQPRGHAVAPQPVARRRARVPRGLSRGGGDGAVPAGDPAGGRGCRGPHLGGGGSGPGARGSSARGS